MSHALGCYYAPEHSRQSDRDYIAALQPPVIRLLDCDVQQIADMHALAPNAIIAPRTWIIDDNSGAAVRNFMADPIGTGRDHANQYRGQLDRWQQEAQQRGLKLPSPDHIYFNAANEPNQGGTPDKIAAYNVAFLDRCTELNIRAAALCLGVGWPDNTGPDTPVNWTPYAALPAAIKRGNHWLELHEYNYKTGPQDGWRWLAGRHLQCPFDVPILLGEIGVDNYVDKPRWDKEGGNRGWQGNVNPDVYAEMIEYHITHSDRRVVAGLIFITDYRNNEWQNFDTNAAHNALLARKDRMVPQAAPPSSPGPQPVPQPVEWDVMWVNAPSGAIIRVSPNASSEKVTAVAYGEPVEESGSDVGAEGMYWSRVRYQGATGWIRGDLLSAEPPVKPEPQPVPQPQPPVKPVEPAPSIPTGIIEPRVAQAILKVESGGRTHGEDGRIIIRFEAHIFKTYLKNDALWAQHFSANAQRPWMNQQWRADPNGAWLPIHTGKQADEWVAFEFANNQLSTPASFMAISMGAAQIMGFNFARIGYPSAADMYTAFRDPLVQTIGFINFFLSDPALADAMRRKDWREIAKRYNGASNIDVYAPLLEKAYRELGGT